MFTRWVRNALRRRRSHRVYVRLLMASGPPVLLGPMDRLSAEILLVHRLGPHPYHFQRRVASARIIGDRD